MVPCNDGGAPRAGAQVQYSLLDRRAENGMAAFCAGRGIRLLPYGTTAGGLLSDKFLGLPAGRCGGKGSGACREEPLVTQPCKRWGLHEHHLHACCRRVSGWFVLRAGQR